MRKSMKWNVETFRKGLLRVSVIGLCSAMFLGGGYFSGL